MLQLGGGEVEVTGGPGGIDGDVCIGPNGELSITGGQSVSGSVRLASGATIGKTKPGATGTVVSDADLSSEIGDAITAQSAAQALACTQTFASLKTSGVIVGAGGENVICVGDVILNGGRTVTLSGGPDDSFVVNVTGRFTLTGGSRIVASGVAPGAILYDIIGEGQQVALNGNARIDGTILALDRDIAATPAEVTGEVIGGRKISITGSGSVPCASCPVITTTSTTTSTTAPHATSTTTTVSGSTTTTMCASSCINPVIGAAGACTVLELDEGDVNVTGGPGGIDGDVCIGPEGKLSVTGGQSVTGNVRLASRATFKKSGSGSVGGVRDDEDLGAAVTDAIDAATRAGALACTRTLDRLTHSQVIVGTGGQNVLCVDDVMLNGGQVVTLSGGPGDTFTLNVTERFALTGGSKIVASGVPPSAILYNVLEDGPPVMLNGGASLDGTLLAAERDLALTPAVVNGGVIGGRNINITGRGSVLCRSCSGSALPGCSGSTGSPCGSCGDGVCCGNDLGCARDGDPVCFVNSSCTPSNCSSDGECGAGNVCLLGRTGLHCCSPCR